MSCGKFRSEGVRYEDNVDGAWYTTDQCISCDLCSAIAPDFFAVATNQGFSYVHKQPHPGEEEELCWEALQNCPVEAIGNSNG